jgi:hypothetical protein
LPLSRFFLKDCPTLLDKKRSATAHIQSSDETALDQVLPRITALAQMPEQCAQCASPTGSGDGLLCCFAYVVSWPKAEKLQRGNISSGHWGAADAI